MLMGTYYQEAILRLSLALVSGGILGFERSSKGIDAGFRTHILVCMSSCAIMLTNLHVFLFYNVGDPTRMPAQVISGLGFLGAGCILVSRQQRIKGVTTAAGLWSAACLGLCIGAGDYIVAGFLLAAAILALTFFHLVETKLIKKTRYLRFYAEFSSVTSLTGFLKDLGKRGIRITGVEIVDSKISGNAAAVLSIHLSRRSSAMEMLKEFENADGVSYIVLI